MSHCLFRYTSSTPCKMYNVLKDQLRLESGVMFILHKKTIFLLLKGIVVEIQYHDSVTWNEMVVII